MNKHIFFPLLFASVLSLASCNNTPGEQEVIHVESVSLSVDSVSLNVGDTYTINPVIAPENASNKEVTYSTSNEAVAMVSTTGLVYAVEEGAAFITVTSVDGNKQASLAVRVSDGGDVPPVESDFTRLVNEVKTKHNYTIDIYSVLEQHQSEEDIYEDKYYCIDDKAFYHNFYSGYEGIIYQKDQGYVRFIESADGMVSPSTFYSTNPNIGITSIYDLNAENLFLADYTEDETTKGLYHCTNEDVLAVAANFSGWIESSWFIAGEEVRGKVVEGNLVIESPFRVWYMDEESGDKILENGLATITISKIGSTHNEGIESYIENPTKTYNTRTDWTASEKLIFNTYFNELVLPYVPNASYSLDVSTEEVYDGVDIWVEDYACGNILATYRNQLKALGFEEGGNDANLLTLVINDAETSKTHTFTIKMAYAFPTQAYAGRTIGDFYPNGVFQMKLQYRCRVTGVSSVAEFNTYILNNHLELYVPLLPFGEECTKISGFEDRTANNIQLFGDYFLFVTSTNLMKWHFESFEAAKIAYNNYLAALVECGYTSIEHDASGTMTIATNKTWNAGDGYESFVQITDMSLQSSSSWKGYIQVLYKVYKPSHPKEEEQTVYPKIGVQANAHMSSYQITDANGTLITTYNPEVDGGYFYAKFTMDPGYIVSSVSLLEDDQAIVDYQNGRWEIKPSTYNLEKITLVVEAEQNGYLLTAGTVQGCEIRLVGSTSGSYYAADERIQFTVVVSEGYELQGVYLAEDPNYVISKNIMGNNSYYFFMPAHNATIMATLSGEGGGEQEVVLTSIAVSRQTTSYYVDDTFSFDGVVTAYYSDNTSKTVTPTSVSTPDMSEAGNKTVTVTYTEGEVTKTATYSISVSQKSTPVDPGEFGGTYSWYKGKMAGYDTYFRFVFNDDGTGEFIRDPKPGGNGTSSIAFTYTVNDDQITIVLSGQPEDTIDFTDFSTYRPFDDNHIYLNKTPENTGTINSDGTVTFTLYNSSGTATGQYTFSK